MNEPAFLEFYARTAGRLNGYLRKLTGDTAIAEDLLQESYLRFLSHGSVPEDDDHRRNYLFRIATNLARDYFRRAVVARNSREYVARNFSCASLAADAERKFCATYDLNHDPLDVWRGLARVSPRDRELLVLAYVEGMTHKEIAKITGLMRASIKPLLFRARRRFAAALQAPPNVEGAVPEASS